MSEDKLSKFYISRPRGATRNSASGRRTRKTPSWFAMWFGAGILVGALVTAITVTNWIHGLQEAGSTVAPSVRAYNSTTGRDSNSGASEKLASKSPTQFEFYTLLPKFGNKAKKEDESIKSSKTLDLKQSSPNYVIQVGSFRSLDDAEELKARLTLQGYSTTVSKTRLSNGGHWYRVTIGPFLSRDSAKTQQLRLANEQYHSTLVLKQSK